MPKLNCWEFIKCGREPGGARADELAVCPASSDERFEAVHGGHNAGRACWIVAGTLCGVTAQGTFATKYGNCKECQFYELVRREELPDFILSATLLEALQ